MDGLDFENARDMLWEVIQKEFRRLQYLLQDERLSKPDRENFSSLMTARVSDSVIQKSLSLLTEILYRYHGQKVILLIDEYDVPLDKAFQHGYYEEMAALIRGLFGQALKTNEFLQFAVLTGCLRVSKESIFTGLNNFDVNSIVDVEHDEQFGFTDSEVQKLLADYGLEEKADVIKDWYDGYRFGDASIYCPWDVIKYAKKLLADPCAEPEAFWINTSGNELVKRFIDKADKTTQDEIECLIAGEVIEKAVRLDLTYNELDTSIENLWSVLFTTGYLTQTDRAAGGIYKLVIPNREVREVFVLQIKEWFRKITLADTARIQRFCAAFPAGDAATIQDMLHDYLWDSISVRDTAVRSDRKENFYHGMLVGLLQSRENWLIQSNTENGEGYSDITVCTPERTGIVIELKYADDGNLEKECLQALEQIEKKKYAAGLQHRGMKKVIRYGMAFWKKECMVVMAQAPDQP